MASIKINHLYQFPENVSKIAHWIWKEFWTDKPAVTPQSMEQRLLQAVGSEKIPLSLVAWYDDIPAGTVNLIECDDEDRTHLSPWLAALYVEPQFRKLGIGKALVKQLLKHAVDLRFKEVFLGTDNPEFYKNLGATVFEEARKGFFIMRFDVSLGVR